MWMRLLLGTLKKTTDIKDSLPRLLSGTFCFVSCFLPDFMLEEMTLEIRSFMQGGGAIVEGGIYTPSRGLAPVSKVLASIIHRQTENPVYSRKKQTGVCTATEWMCTRMSQSHRNLLCSQGHVQG